MRYVLILFCAIVWAQDPVPVGKEPYAALSFAQMGPNALKGALGVRVKGVAVLKGTICSGDDIVTMDAGQILQQAHKNNVLIFDGLALDALLTREGARSLPQLAANIGEGLALGTSVATSTEMVKADKKTIAYSVFAVGFFRYLAGMLGKRQLEIRPRCVALCCRTVSRSPLISTVGTVTYWPLRKSGGKRSYG